MPCPLRPTNDSLRVEETYVKVKGVWMYLYRAVDSDGSTIKFMLSRTRDGQAAKRFFRKALRAPHAVPPHVSNVDKNPAYPKQSADLRRRAFCRRGARCDLSTT
jgi:transposase, IS6 family